MSVPAALTTVDDRVAGVLHDGGGEPSGHSPRPFLHPVSTPGGRSVSDYRPEDHPWHWGLGIAVSTIDVVGQAHPANLWGGPTYRDGAGYVKLPNNGSQEVRVEEGRDDGRVQQLDWRTADGTVFLAETRSWHAESVRAGGVEWLATTVRSRWANTSGGPLAFGSPTTSGRPDAGYGGFFLRLAPSFAGACIVAASTGPAPSDVPAPPGGAGTRLSEADAMGSTRSWLGLRSPDASVLMVPAADNPGGSSPWFVRSTGTPMLCAAPFFHRKLHLGVGGVLHWTWSLLTADGPVQDDAFAAAADAV
ncbi:DUF6807 family protein [Arthrobacter sp. NPDC092385]|uniref:DUF6807 family protein n=1 Tax=Arthrobacter sp. NPDC092385 TaxID=3363943 RepID=UPI0037F2B611